MDQQKLEIKNFIRGITDSIIGRDPNFSATLKNYNINIDGSITVRPGSTYVAENGATNVYRIGQEKPYLVKPLQGETYPYLASNVLNYYATGSPGSWTTLTGPSSNNLFPVGHLSASDYRVINSRWSNQVFLNSASLSYKMQKVFFASDGTTRVLRTAGLPKFDGTAPTYTTAGTAGSYIYAYVWKYTYKSGARTYTVRSNPYFSINQSFIWTTITVPNVGTFSNGATNNYFLGPNTSEETIVLEAYRTINNGLTTQMYLVGSINYTDISGTITDGISDANLVLNQQLYTNGGVVPNEKPPIHKYDHITERSVGYYGYVVDGSDTLKNRVIQSIPGTPEMVSMSFFDDIDDDEVSGISSFRGVGIVFGPNNVYRIEGEYSSRGEGGFKCRKIASDVGATSHQGIVQTYTGVFFSGKYGFYWTDGYQVKKISDEINTQYRDYYSTDAKLQSAQGTYNEIDQQVMWTFPESATADGIYVFHLRYGVKADGVFTTWGGFVDLTFPESGCFPSSSSDTFKDNFKARSVLFFNDQLFRLDWTIGDGATYALTHSILSPTTTDPLIDSTREADDMNDVNPIVYEYATPALDFGSVLIRKWVTKIVTSFQNLGDISIQIATDRDLQEVFVNLKEIKVVSSYSWGSPSVSWGDEVIYESANQMIFASRRLVSASYSGSTGLRCTNRQFRYKNSFTLISTSADYATATLDATAKTVTIDSGSWPTRLGNYYIAFSSDNYTNKYLMQYYTYGVPTEIALSSSISTGELPASGSYSWKIYGYAKGDVNSIASVSIEYSMLTDSYKSFTAGSENATT